MKNNSSPSIILGRDTDCLPLQVLQLRGGIALRFGCAAD
jgi:hypothetical protein